MDKFYVGAKVVCVDSDVDVSYKKGKVYEVFGVSVFPCRCKDVVLDLGFSNKNYDMECCWCGDTDIKTNGIEWCQAEDFRLIDEIELSETYSDEILDLINANA